MGPSETWKANRGGFQEEVSSVEYVWAERLEEGIAGRPENLSLPSSQRPPGSYVWWNRLGLLFCYSKGECTPQRKVGCISKRVLEISYYGFGLVLSALRKGFKTQGFALDWSRDNLVIWYLNKSLSRRRQDQRSQHYNWQRSSRLSLARLGGYWSFWGWAMCGFLFVFRYEYIVVLLLF